MPRPVCEDHPEYEELYQKAWELAHEHIRDIPGMCQNPYMDEAFCDTQIWIWDTCFMAMFCKYARDVFPGVESFRNFYGVLYEKKHLPKVIPGENEPKWTNAKPGEPFEIAVHIADNPPLFAWAEVQNALMAGDREYVKNLLYRQCFLQKHYEWIEQLDKPTILPGVSNPTCLIAQKYGYQWEGGRSGMDNTPRGRTGGHALEQRPNHPDMLWIDAICQQALSARMISRLYGIVNDRENQKKWNDKFLEKKEIVNRFYWNAEDRFYYDIDRRSFEFLKVKTIASFWSLTAGIASEKQAQLLAEHLDNPETFGGEVPFVSLARNDGDFNPNGEYWRGSVWLPTAYAALTGLKEYGYYKTAHRLSCKLLDRMLRTFLEVEPHTIWECYCPTEDKPAANEAGKTVRPDFCGWSALGPISVYIEFVLGFHTIDAFEKTVEWEKPPEFRKKIGIENLRFGNIVTDITAENGICRVFSNDTYTLKINGKPYRISVGENILDCTF